MVWISETHRLNCWMSVCWKRSAKIHPQLLAFLHYSQESSFFFPFCTFGSCWAICNTDTCLHMRSKRLMISLLVSKIYWISLIVYAKQSKLRAILQTTARKHNFSHKLTHSCTHIHVQHIIVNTNIVWRLFLVKGKCFNFILSVMQY